VRVFARCQRGAPNNLQPLYAAWRPPPGAAPSLTNIWQGW